jgi:hypothetical protein
MGCLVCFIGFVKCGLIQLLVFWKNGYFLLAFSILLPLINEILVAFVNGRITKGAADRLPMAAPAICAS